MTKQQKIESLEQAMTVKKRDNGTGFTCFGDDAPEELVDIFLEYYEVRDVHYEIFSDAIDLVAEIYDGDKTEYDDVVDAIYDSEGHASLYNQDRLDYLNVWNQDEVTGIIKEGATDITEACARWYDREVEQAGIIIINWINE